MENNIILPKNNFNFDNITVLSPSTIQGKTFLSKIQNENTDLYIQTPKCVSKNAFVTSGKKTYIDLLFEKDNDEFIEWFENLENKIQLEIYNKRERWFRGENIEKSDIEDIFTSPIKTYKSGKFYALRVYLGSPRLIQHTPLNIFNENENKMEMDDIQENTKMITILQLHGLKFNVNINFQIYIELKQILVIDEEKMFKKPLFKINNKHIDRGIEENKTLVSSIGTSDTIVKSTEDLNNTNSLEENNEFKVNTVPITNDTLYLEEHTDNDLEESINNNLEETKINNLEKKIDNNLEKKIDNNLEEFNPHVKELDESFTIKKPDDVYMELYKDAKEKAKQSRLDAIKAYMELKHIKQNYQIDDLDSDNDFSESEFQSSDEESDSDQEEKSPKLNFIELS
jgi:hypothetical protein